MIHDNINRGIQNRTKRRAGKIRAIMTDAVDVRTAPSVWVSLLGAADVDDSAVEDVTTASLVVASVGEGVIVVNAVATAGGAGG